MINKLKLFLKPFIGKSNFKLIYNYYVDFVKYKKYSTIFSLSNYENKEAILILHYHGLEKGMLHDNMKPRFAIDRVKELHKMLADREIQNNINATQVEVGYKVLCKYYEIHSSKAIDISDYYTEEQYYKYKKLLQHQYDSSFEGVLDWDVNTFFVNKDANFGQFAHSRKSVRNFTGELIDINIINQVIELANTAPSVCNRQASKVYLVNDKEKIDKVLKIQGGLGGYTDDITQILILTNDRNFYYTVGERHQFYIDGGIYLMNLLYALHFYGIGNCPANWGKEVSADKNVRNYIDLPDGEQIICVVAIGKLKEQFKTTLSFRRKYFENLKVIN